MKPTGPPRRRQNHERSKKHQQLVAQLRATPTGLDAGLARLVPCGVAFHHAGLTVDERALLEGGFRDGALAVLMATSTLATGVNLPAHRVVFRTPYVAAGFLDAARYRAALGDAAEILTPEQRAKLAERMPRPGAGPFWRRG